MLLQALMIAGVAYIAALIIFSYSARKQVQDSKSYFLAGSNLGALLGFFTFAATLFSTFTLQGMPDFFRTHGVAAWIFLAVSDAIMVFGVIWVGFYFRKKALEKNYFGMAGFLSREYQFKWAGYVAFFGAFIFLIPYVAIQIRGVSSFLNATFPESMPMELWACLIVTVMVIYSEIGGLKAIIYSDVLQGILLLIAIWVIGLSCLDYMGGIESMFDQVEEKNPALLSSPGPKGLLDVQFLIGSALAIILLPFTQPQVSTRLAIMKSPKALFRMAIGLGFFAIIIILPTAFVGMYGAIEYPDATAPEFWNRALVVDQSIFIGALVIIGLIAAAISTSDSQIFALGGEIRSLLTGEDKHMMLISRICIFAFALAALVFAVLSSDQLVSLARVSFAGTSLMAPMIFVAIFSNKAASMKWLPLATFVGLALFIASLFSLVPGNIAGLRLDLFLLLILAIIAIVGVVISQSKKQAVTQE